MELRHLQYLIAVAEEGTFTRAAARVHVAQPGVSAQIRQLERELGQELLVRGARRVTLTEAGAAVLPYARAALAAVAAARDAADELAGLLRGHITIGTVTSVSSEGFDLPALLARFHGDHPNVGITLTADNSDELIRSLHHGRVDLALLGLGSTEPAGLDIHVITEEPLVAAVGPSHPLAARSSITLPALIRHELISLPRGTGLRSCLDDACAAAGLAPTVSLEAGDPRTLAQLAAHGLGVAIVPRSITDARPGELRGLPISRPGLRGRIALAWRAAGPVSPAARELLRRARAAGATSRGPSSGAVS
jgi:DNA-binding transcriptional LysR family regulator